MAPYLNWLLVCLWHNDLAHNDRKNLSFYFLPTFFLEAFSKTLRKACFSSASYAYFYSHDPDLRSTP